MKRLIICFSGFLIFSGCSNNQAYKEFLHHPDLYSQTVHELNTVVMGNNFPPMVASRNYAYAAVAAYEVIAAGYPYQYQSLVGQLNGLKSMPVLPSGADIDYPLAALLAYIKVGEAVTFPEGSMQNYRDSIINLARTKGLPRKVEKASRELADSISAGIIRWSKKTIIWKHAEQRNIL